MLRSDWSTGVAHVNLKLPRKYLPPGLEYPKNDSPELEEELWLEHYSWKKVTTNVSGFIVGNPSIDHYGDMIVSTCLSTSLRSCQFIESTDHESSNW